MRFLWLFLFLISGTVQAQRSDFPAIDFRRADSIASVYQGAKLNNLALLSHQLTNSLPYDIEKFRAIYTWVCKNIENDHWVYLKNKKKRKQLQNDSEALTAWQNQFRLQMFKKLRKEQKAVCTGYAYLIKELANLADLECEIVDGHGRTSTSLITEKTIPNHSWNAVNLNNKWYLCDATWSSGSVYIHENRFVADYNDGYFLTSPELFILKHYPLNPKWILMKQKPSFEEFTKFPVVYKDAFKYDIIPVEPKSLNLEITKHDEVKFLFKASDAINITKIKFRINKATFVKPNIRRTSEGLLELKYQFNRYGIQDVHVMLGEQFLFTYTITVKKTKN